MSKLLAPAQKALIRRYLIWCYKTTKEELDRVDRYFTQLLVDEFVLKTLRQDPAVKNPKGRPAYRQKVEEFKKYMQAKEERVLAQKYADSERKVLQPDYWYLKTRLDAVEKAIGRFCGRKDLLKIQTLYEEEMTRRIIGAREHT